MRHVTLPLCLMVLAGCDGGTPAKRDTETDTAQVTIPATPEANWTYTSSDDAMRGTKSSFATATSKEDFPNSLGTASSRTELTVQHRPEGREVSLSNPGLQYVCTSYTHTYVSVKFDGDPVKRYRCTEAKGSTFGVLFILPAAAFIKRLSTAKSLVIETEVFQRGDVQQSFQVSGLTLK